MKNIKRKSSSSKVSNDKDIEDKSTSNAEEPAFIESESFNANGSSSSSGFSSGNFDDNISFNESVSSSKKQESFEKLSSFDSSSSFGAFDSDTSGYTFSWNQPKSGSDTSTNMTSIISGSGDGFSKSISRPPPVQPAPTQQSSYFSPSMSRANMFAETDNAHKRTKVTHNAHTHEPQTPNMFKPVASFNPKHMEPVGVHGSDEYVVKQIDVGHRMTTPVMTEMTTSATPSSADMDAHFSSLMNSMQSSMQDLHAHVKSLVAGLVEGQVKSLQMSLGDRYAEIDVLETQTHALQHLLNEADKCAVNVNVIHNHIHETSDAYGNNENNVVNTEHMTLNTHGINGRTQMNSATPSKNLLMTPMTPMLQRGIPLSPKTTTQIKPIKTGFFQPKKK